MIRAFLAPLATKIMLGIIAALALFAGVQTLRLSWAHEAAAEAERDRSRQVAQAVAQARKADAAAQNTVDASKALSGAEIAKAREAAAANPDDPLRAAMEALR